METSQIQLLTETFEGHAQKTDNGVEYWLARDLQVLLGYTEWRNFLNIINKGETACQGSGHQVEDHFVDVNKMVLDLVAGPLAGRFSLIDDVQKVAPFGVTEQNLQIAG